MRTIKEIIHTNEGAIAHSNDGRAFVLVWPEYTWKALPGLPQDGYVDPIEENSNRLKEALPRIMEAINQDLPKLLDLINEHIHASHMRVVHGGAEERSGRGDGMHECPDHDCKFVGTVSQVLEHMKEKHPERIVS